MLEGLAAWVLNTYVGEYIENLNTDQLSIGLLQGEVELENLPLKKDAFKSLNLPIEVLSGFIGKIKLQIPIRHLRSEPWVISLEHLYITIGPVSADDVDEETCELNALERKLAQLDVLEQRWRAQFDSKQEPSYYSTSYSSWLSYGSSFITNILDNIQLKINDVHLRYEDNLTDPEHPFSWGFIINGLYAQSTDESWMPKFMVDDGSNISRKLVELRDLAIYWDPESEMLGHLPRHEFNIAMEELSDTSHSGLHDYIMEPVSAEAKISRNCQPEPLRSHQLPRITCDLLLDKIPLMLTDVQFRGMMLWVKEFERLEQSFKQSKWRPKCTVKENPAEWWKYAISHHLDQIQKQNQKLTWTFISQRSRDIVLYARAYHQSLAGSENLAVQMKAHKASVEKELSFDELMIIRQVVIDKYSREMLEKSEKKSSPKQEKSQTLLQYWFPAWTGWYAGANDSDAQGADDKPAIETEIEKEILNVLTDTDVENSLNKKDFIYCNINSCLRQGTLTLLTQQYSGEEHAAQSDLHKKTTKTSVFELEFGNLMAKLQYRSRSNSTLFHLSLGSIFVKDKVTPETAFPNIISPQSESGLSGPENKNQFGYQSSRESYSKLFSMAAGLTNPNQHDKSLFDIVYEIRPFDSTADYKLHISSRSLDIVYCPSAVQRISSFFSSTHLLTSRKSDFKLTTAAKMKYENLKKQTKDEIKNTFEQLIDGEHHHMDKWDLMFDISAPQFIVPSDVTDRNATLVVFDFGKLYFTSASAKIKRKDTSTFSPDSDDDDDFHTPCSTPPENTNDLPEDAIDGNYPYSSPLGSDIMSSPLEEAVHEKMYDRYTLNLCDLQVLVGRIRDNWRYAHMRGTSTMHVIERFSISLQLERLVMSTTNPQLPAATLSGSLPKLVVHANEPKIQALKTCVATLSESSGSTKHAYSAGYSGHMGSPNSSKTSTNESTPMNEESPGTFAESKIRDEETRLLMAQFCIDQLVLQIQSRGQSIAELQVTGVKSTLTKRPIDTSVCLSVHGFLLVDALQTYGPDYELLIASHKHVSMDSVSGSIRGESEPTSPVSPASPKSPRLSVTSPHALSQALNNLQSSAPPSVSSQVASPPYCASPTSPPHWLKPPIVNDPTSHDSEALISIEYTKIDYSSASIDGSAKTPEAVQLCTVLFNNLDLIANQETIVELLGFVTRAFPSDHTSDEESVNDEWASSLSETSASTVNPRVFLKTELSFDFHRLNVLLLRTLSCDGNTVAQKVATATMTGAKIQATLGEDLSIEGALGGLQLIDLTPEGTMHQRIISVGYDPICHDQTSKISGIYVLEGMDINTKYASKALNFVVTKKDVRNNITCGNHVDLNLRMASVCYIHSPNFLNALQSCASEFKQYTDKLASSLKSAATEVAIGIVDKRTDLISTSFYSPDLSYKERESQSFDALKSDEVDGLFMIGDEEQGDSSELRLDVMLQTPIIVFPKSVLSPQVLVGHLGKISINNITKSHNQTSPGHEDYNSVFEGLSVGCEPVACEDSISIEISNMNVYSLNITDNLPRSLVAGHHPMNLGIDDLYNCSVHGHLILHDTVVNLKVGKENNCTLLTSTEDQAFAFMKKEHDYEKPQQNSISSVLQVTGSVINPLKVVLSKQQYQQILDSLDNITYNDSSGTSSDEASNYKDISDVSKDSDAQQSKEESFQMAIKILFSLPELNLELRGDLGDGVNESHGLVNIGFRDFFVHYQKDCSVLTSIQVSLKSLEMEDLLTDSSSEKRFLMVSYSPPEEHVEKESNPSGRPIRRNSAWKPYLSASCPEIVSKSLIGDHDYSSLPDHLNTKSMFQSDHQSVKRRKVFVMNDRSKFEERCPITPPASPVIDPTYVDKDLPSSTLVHINTLLVDKTSPEYVKKYNTTNRFIDIDFNCLDTTINVRTWVMVLDFFGIGSEDVTEQLFKKTSEERRNITVEDALDQSGSSLQLKEVINSEIDVKIRSLSLILNKPEYELTKANVSNCISHLSLRSGNFSIIGQLGSMSLTDLSPHADLYPERFTTSGHQALDFKIFKYGTKDIKLEREFDIKVQLRMSSICYVHTQRFQAEVTAFFQHFTQLQIILNEIRAAAVGNLAQDILPRGSRIKLDIKADSPVIVLPMSSHSPELIVMNLGKLVVNNSFLFAGSPGSISVLSYHHPLRCGQNDIDKMAPAMLHSIYGSLDVDHRNPGLNQISAVASDEHVCLLDVMNIELEEIDLYTAVTLPNSKLNKESKNDGINFSTFSIIKEGGPLLKNKFVLRLQAERNLDGAISHSVPDISVKGMISSVHVSLDVDQYKLVRGLLAHNLGESLEEFEIACNSAPESVNKENGPESTWVGMSICIDLMNVTIELMKSHCEMQATDSCLAQIDLIRSKLSYQSFSDQSKEVDLVSQEILMSDTRFRDSPANSRPNVFVNILQPMHASKLKKKGTLQAEVHYRTGRDSACFTILINNMRIMGVFDWLLSLNEFLMNNPDNPHKRKDLNKISTPMSPRRSSKFQNKEPTLELKLNIMDTELVVVEDTSSWDTNAVILKSTAVLSFKMEACEKPLSCSLQSLEVFSCTLGLEEETALSIIDPVTVNVEVNIQPTTSSSQEQKNILEVTLQNLSVRLSYYDMQMFCRIFDSVPKQMTFRRSSNNSLPANISVPVEKLKALGFSHDDCMKAIQACDGKLDEAALWLTQQCEVDLASSSLDVSNKLLEISDVEVRVSLACFCLIDDCKDADVPLLELSFKEMCVMLNLRDKPQVGCSEFTFACDYYNRQCSAWEPCVESWLCQLNWTLDTNKVFIKLQADETINLNLTSSMLELYQNVHDIWTEDYYNSAKSEDVSSNESGKAGYYRRRSPFVPYALKNETGCKLWFTTHTTTPTKIFDECPEIEDQAWNCVEPDQEVPFIFESRTKMRHLKSHELNIHQIVIRVFGWKSISPVSVDKVGTYFRYMRPDSDVKSEAMRETRVIFNVCLEGTARKLITVKSAISVQNKLKDSVELKLEKPIETKTLSAARKVMSYTMVLAPQVECSLPIHLIDACIWIRPAELPIGFFNSPIKWQDVTAGNACKNEYRTCYPTSSHLKPYRMCIRVQRENYPVDTYANQPGHCITLVAPITIFNLLPCELHYRIRGSVEEIDCLKSGKEAILTTISVAETVELLLTIENFSHGAELIIPPGTKNFLAKICVYDDQNRPLVIHVRVYPHVGGALQLFVSVPYWLVNKTGLPLLFKQHGMSTEAAGQGDEHEMARSVAPLMFSFADPEMSTMCSMRLGKSVHREGITQWCSKFHLEKGIRVRPLRASPLDSRPDWVYIIGVEVRVGTGRYQDTHIVTLTPRFQIENHSSYKLEVTQRFAVNGKNEHHLLSVPRCTLPFHWPRIDLDHLLCIRIADIPSCHWSGGIKIDRIDSFHINVRDQECNIHFVHVEVILQGATFFIIFTDADKMPAPYRIRNQSEVPITFYQRDVPSTRFHTTVRAHNSLVYAWDESTLSPYITCVAPGGSSTSCNMNKFGGDSQLTYENFIYIAFTGTFNKLQDHAVDKYEELVLDITPDKRVILSKKEAGKRSQLWRMNVKGQLEHEGSRAPRDPRKTSTPEKPNHAKLVLDLAGIGPQPGSYTPLMLRKSDERRRSTQTWHFTDDGRLSCEHNNMFVQANDGYYGLRAGNEVVLGLTQPVSYARLDNGIPLEQAIERQRFRAGSGMLSVSVVADGPTRVLLIEDLKNKVMVTRPEPNSDWFMVEKASGKGSEETKTKQSEFKLDLNLVGGIGISLINSKPEELMYCILHNISVQYIRHTDNHSIEACIRNIQIDNQLIAAECPVVLFVTPPSHRDPHANQPAICISAARVPMDGMNAEIFKHLIITTKNMTLNIEEVLLWKLLQFCNLGQVKEENIGVDESNYQSHRCTSVKQTIMPKRYYFSLLKIVINFVKLSMLTSSKLPPPLLAIKRAMGWRLIRFEDALVELDTFHSIHPFETGSFLINTILEHYREELKSQAAKILGAFDFLGNPLGLMNDVSEGVSTLLYEGDVGGLLKNVTHGLSNSAAKVTGSLSEGLGKVTMDDRHETLRLKMRTDRSSSSGEHLVAGLKGFGHGLLGGVTSLITQTYTGAANEGVQGFFSGIGKGLVGTVTKPAVGVLDLATGAASAVRDTSRSENRVFPPRVRLSRLCLGPNGALPIYSLQQAHGQDYLYSLNDRDYSESLIAYELLLTGKEDLKILISSKMIRIISSNQSSSTSVKIILQIPYSDLFYCKYVESKSAVNETKHYIELTKRVDGASPGQVILKRPQVRCNNEVIAQKVAQEVNYAKIMFEEVRQSITTNAHS